MLGEEPCFLGASLESGGVSAGTTQRAGTMLLVHAASLAFTTEVQAKDVEGWVKTPILMPDDKNEEQQKETRTRSRSTSFLPGPLLAHELGSSFPFQRRENQEMTCPGSNTPEFESQLLDFPSTSALSTAAHCW